MELVCFESIQPSLNMFLLASSFLFILHEHGRVYALVFLTECISIWFFYNLIQHFERKILSYLYTNL